MKKKTVKAAKPITIKIQGPDFHVDAAFPSSPTGKSIAAAIEGIAGKITTPPIVERNMSPLVELVSEFARSIRPDQLPAMKDSLDTTQQLLAMEILGLVQPIAPDFTVSQQTSPPEHDFDIVKRVIDHAVTVNDPAMLRAIYDLAKMKIEAHGNPQPE